jgi:hypothetical protein
MKERPILFQGAMVRAILAGTKTQTRRVVKPTPTRNAAAMWSRDGLLQVESGPRAAYPITCPYGQPGDRLWVRETYSGPYVLTGTPPREWPSDAPIWCWADGDPTHGDWTKPKPGMHMPRSASRIDVEVTEVRVERLQEISEADAKAEGVLQWAADLARDGSVTEADIVAMAARYGTGSLRGGYAALWDSINGMDGHSSWQANPWVWAVSFRTISPGAAKATGWHAPRGAVATSAGGF